MADVEVLVGGEPVEVLIDSGALEVSVAEDGDFEVMQASGSALEITAKATSLTALIISLYARFALFLSGSPLAAELLYRTEIADQITIAANLALSRGSSVTAATGEAVFSFKKNGVEFGTATFAAAGSAATFAGSATTFNVGDILTVYAPASQDATLANVSLTLAGTRVV